MHQIGVMESPDLSQSPIQIFSMHVEICVGGLVVVVNIDQDVCDHSISWSELSDFRTDTANNTSPIFAWDNAFGCLEWHHSKDATLFAGISTECFCRMNQTITLTIKRSP
jgi:hypothetical protein